MTRTALSVPGARAVLLGTGTHVPREQDDAGSLSDLPSLTDLARPADLARLTDVPTVAPTLRAVEDCLVECCSMPRRQIRSRLDPGNPTRVLDLLRSTAEAADTLLFVYYVGHGLIDDDGELHLALSTTPGRALVFGDALPFREVRRAIENPAGDRSTILVLDCCYSGRAMAVSERAARAGFGQSHVRGTYVLTSANWREQAWAGLGRNFTTFSGELIRLLREGAAQGPPAWTLDALYDQMYRVTAGTATPLPRRHAQDQIGSLVLAPNPAHRQPSPPDIAFPPPTGWAATARPYRGLDPYSADDHAIFFGREALTAELLSRLEKRAAEPGLQIVMGPSGAGKTSLLQAGLLHAIAMGELDIPGSARWPHIVIRPGPDPLGTLAEKIGGHVPAVGGGEPSISAVRATLREDPTSLGRLLRQLAEAGVPSPAAPAVPSGPAVGVLLVVDQFEEVFTRCEDELVREAFLAALAAAAGPGPAGSPAAALVVLGVRSDFHGFCAGIDVLRDALTRDHLAVGPMDRASLRAAVERPAAAAGLGLEPGLVELLLADADADLTSGRPAGTSTAILPLLSHAMQATWERRIAVRTEDGPRAALTVDGYSRTGGIRGALSASAERAVDALDDAGRATVRRVMLSLVGVTEAGDTVVETRRRAPIADLVTRFPAAQEVLTTFASARLVTLSDDGAELAHEALLHAWPRLRQWINQDRAWLELANTVSANAAAWRRSGDARRERVATLFQAGRLEALHRQAADGGHDVCEFDQPSREFLTASAREVRRRVRRRRGVAGVLVGLTVASIGLSVFAGNRTTAARRQRDLALSRSVAIQADQTRATDPTLSRLLGVAAYRLTPTVEAHGQLLSSASMPGVTRVRHGAGTLLGTALSPDGSIVATVGTRADAQGSATSGTVELWSVRNRTRPTHLATIAAGPAAASALAFSPHGDLLAVGAGDGTVRLWNVTAPGRPWPERPLTGHRGRVFGLAFHPDGHLLATAGADGTVRLWTVDGTSPERPAGQLAAAVGPPLTVNTAPVSSSSAGPAATGQAVAVAFSADGRHLVAAANVGRRVWTVADPARPTPVAEPAEFAGGTASEQVVFSPATAGPAGALFATTDGLDARLWRMDGAGRVMPAGAPLRGHGGIVFGVAFSPDGGQLASGSDDKTVRLWDVATGSLLDVLPHPQAVEGVTYVGSRSEIATAGLDGWLRLWHLPGRAPIGSAQITSVTLVANRPVMVTGDAQRAVRIWDVSHPDHPIVRATLPPPDSPTLRMSVSPDGTILAVPMLDGTLRLWDIADPDHPVPLGPPVRAHGPGRVYAAVFDPRGRVLATVGQDGTTQLWEVTGRGGPRPIGARLGTTGSAALFCAAFSPDGTTLVVGGAGSTTRLYDVTDPASPHPLGDPLRGHSGGVLQVRFAPRGGRAGDCGRGRPGAPVGPHGSSTSAAATQSGQRGRGGEQHRPVRRRHPGDGQRRRLDLAVGPAASQAGRRRQAHRAPHRRAGGRLRPDGYDAGHRRRRRRHHPLGHPAGGGD
jgi:WD40 repeat protein